MNLSVPNKVTAHQPKRKSNAGQFLGVCAKGFIFAGLAMIGQSCVEHRTTNRTEAAHNESPFSRPSDFAGKGNAARILMVGDSLTVGGFGDAMQTYLLGRFGSDNVAVYASCGSSPEHWMRSGPKFITKCGYREQTPSSSKLYDYERGKRPQQVLTPKLEDLVATFHPTIVIVQLGTNWMDGMHSNPASDRSAYGKVIDRFVTAIHSDPNTVREIIWITPPDSSRYSKAVEARVKDQITGAAARDSFETIDSSSMTHYVRGKSGGDGVHYNSEEAKVWANRVTRELDHMLR